MHDIIDRIDKILTNLNWIGGVDACIIASRAGLHIRSILQKEQFAESIAAMSAAMLGAAETSTTELGKGIPNRVIVETEHGRLIAVGAGPKALLIVIVTSDVGLG